MKTVQQTKTKTIVAVAMAALAIAGTAAGLIMISNNKLKNAYVGSSAPANNNTTIPASAPSNITASGLACPTIKELNSAAIADAIKRKPVGSCAHWIVPGPTNLLKEPYCSESNALPRVNRLSSEPSPYIAVGAPGYWAMPNAQTNRLTKPYWVGCGNPTYPNTASACPTIEKIDPAALYTATGICLVRGGCSNLPVRQASAKPIGTCISRNGKWIVPGPTNLLKEPYCSESNALPRVNRLSSEPSPYIAVGAPGYWAMPNAQTNRLTKPYWVGCMNNMPALPTGY